VNELEYELRPLTSLLHWLSPPLVAFAVASWMPDARQIKLSPAMCVSVTSIRIHFIKPKQETHLTQRNGGVGIPS
jgi:hypothetical protein